MNTGLAVREDIGIGASEAAETNESWDTFDEVNMELHSAGFSPVDAPQFELPILTPSLLTDATGTGITELYVKIGGWRNYNNAQLSEIRGRLLQANNELKFLAVSLRKSLKDRHKAAGMKPPTGDEKEEEVMLDSRYIEVTQLTQRFEQAKSFLEERKESLKDALRIVSRQVEIRRQDMESLSGGRGYSTSRMNQAEPGHK